MFAVILLIMSSILVKADIFNFSEGGFCSSSSGPWAFKANPAGIVENELRRVLLEGTFRLGTNNSRSFSISLVQPPEDSLAGVLNLSTDLTDFDVQRLSFLYVIAGKAGSTNLGVGLGLDRVQESNGNYYSVFLDLGVQGKFSDSGYTSYSLALKRLQLWSQKTQELKLFSVGGGLKLDFEQMVFAFDVAYFFENLDFWQFVPATQLNVEPVKLHVSLPFLYKSLNESNISVEFGVMINLGTVDLGLSVLYPFSPMNSNDLLKELGYKWHIDFKIGFKW